MRGEQEASDRSILGDRAAAYHDRLRTPDETVALVRPHFASLGITRVARQTGLDHVGIPCFAAFRPNSRSIACNQGKGVDDDLAMASAVMEAVEYAIAEQPRVHIRRASIADLEAAGQPFHQPANLLPLGETVDRRQQLNWARGKLLRDETAAWVPLDAISLNGNRPDLPTVCQNTNGLASGNTPAEALFHAVCELVERDGATLWSLLDLESQRRRCIRPETFDDDLVLSLLARIEAAGLAVRLFDQTSDFGIPTILAVTAPSDGIVVKHFDVAAGAGTHPSPARAALRAITEAAQTRITSIAGARDDIRPDSYRLDGNDEALALVRARPTLDAPPHLPPASSRAETLFAAVLERLAAHGIDDLVAVPLGGEEIGVSVVRVLSRSLEDRGPNANWRPGERALRALLDS